MATFLPGVTDVFAGPSVYTPDFNRIERMLRMKERMYEQGAQRVKSLYDSVFNSAVLREDNTQRRDAYLKTITDSLNKISAMDLSLVQNQELASNLFAPVLNDKNLVKAISYTRNLQEEMSRADSYCTSSDPTTRKMCWDLGKKYLQYKAEEFATADPDSALGMSSPKYIPQVDFLSIAEKAYKDAGISVTEDTINGGYIWTKKNGDAVFPIAQSFVDTLFASDPGIKQMVEVRAYVERKDFIKQNATKFGGEAEAEAFYINDVLKKAGQQIASEMKNTNEEIKTLRSKKESWNKVIAERGIIPGSDEHMEYLADLDKLDLAEKSLQTKKDNILPPSTIDFNNISDLRNQADNLKAFANYTLLSNQVAQLLAFKGAELKVKEDPFAMATLRSELALKNMILLENLRQQNRKDILRMEIRAGKFAQRSREITDENEDGVPDTPLTGQELTDWLRSRDGGGGTDSTQTTGRDSTVTPGRVNLNLEDESPEEPVINE